MKRRLHAVILDLDGTLLDSNEALTQSWMQALREDEIPVAYESLRCKIGIGPDQFLPSVVGIAPDTKRGRKLTLKQEELFREEFLPGIRIFQDVHALLERMHANELRTIAVSTHPLDIAERFVRMLGVPHLVSGELPLKKLFETALERLGTYPSETLLVADTPFDIEAGLRLGIQSIAFRSGGWMDDALEGGIAVYNDPHDLLDNFEASPLGQSLLTKSA